MIILLITQMQFYALTMVDAEYKVIYDPQARKSVAEKANKTNLNVKARSNSSADILDVLSPTELYYHNLYLEFTETANIHAKKMKILLDRIFDDYDKLIPGFVNDIQSEVDLNLDLFWLDKMSPRDSTYSLGLIGRVDSRDSEN